MLWSYPLTEAELIPLLQDTIKLIFEPLFQDTKVT